MRLRRLAFCVIGSGLAALLAAGCVTTPRRLRCQRVDAATLNPENNFATTIDGSNLQPIDVAPEALEVSLTVARPGRTHVTLVHVIGNEEAERWPVQVSLVDILSARCLIAPGPAQPPCGVSLKAPPLLPGGYYYLVRTDENVLEAGLAFRICGSRD